MAKLDPYPSTLTDKEWSYLREAFPPLRLGRPPRYSPRVILNAILYGLKAARAALFPDVLWQRCQFHLQQNALHYVPKLAMRSTVAAQLREVFHAQTRPLAEALLKTMISAHRKSAPELAAWLELNVLILPKNHRLYLRTSNAAERLSQENRCIVLRTSNLLPVASRQIAE